jgi:hypothetical protein
MMIFLFNEKIVEKILKNFQILLNISLAIIECFLDFLGILGWVEAGWDCFSDFFFLEG